MKHLRKFAWDNRAFMRTMCDAFVSITTDRPEECTCPYCIEEWLEQKER